MKTWEHKTENEARYDMYTGERKPDRSTHWIYEGQDSVAILCSTFLSPSEAEKRAALIAAAPEMLAALVKIEAMCSANATELDDDICTLIAGVLAKAVPK